jgi:hypothetical protein
VPHRWNAVQPDRGSPAVGLTHIADAVWGRRHDSSAQSEEVSHLDAERLRELVDVGEADVLFASLNGARIGPVDSSCVGERFLREAPL